MISDYIEALFIKKQKLTELLESETLDLVLKSSEVGDTLQAAVYGKIEKDIAMINSELKSAYNINSELDGGTQFKIFDRVVGNFDEIDQDENPLDQLNNLIKIETIRAISENN